MTSAARVICMMMQKNENLLLEPWIMYYSALFGPENIYIADNGSTSPSVCACLKKHAKRGVHVNYDHNKQVDFENKGNVLRIWSSRIPEADLILFLDADEFIGVEKPDGTLSFEVKDIHAAFDALPRDKPYHYAYKCMYLNIPGMPSFYLDKFHTKLGKHFYKPNTLVHLDVGFHLGKTHPVATKFQTNIVQMHMHNKPYAAYIESVHNKMTSRLDITNRDAVRSYKGSGRHCVAALLQTPEEYMAKFATVKNKVPGGVFRGKCTERGASLPY